MRRSYMLLLVIYNGSLIDSNLVLQLFHSFVVFESFCKVITAMANCKAGRKRRNFPFECVTPSHYQEVTVVQLSALF